jgi:hypothetical protein
MHVSKLILLRLSFPETFPASHTNTSPRFTPIRRRLLGLSAKFSIQFSWSHTLLSSLILGSGKGRALLVASELPFAKIIGVELSRELHRIAEQNLGAIDRHRSGARGSLCIA